MENLEIGALAKNNINSKKILLAILPYWDPIIPPNGIAHLKGFLQKNGYEVKTVDLIIDEVFQNIYRDYFLLLEECIPPSNRGNFYNIGHYLLQYHMMAHFNHNNKNDYIEVVKELVYKTYYIAITTTQAHDLANEMEKFYRRLDEVFIYWLEKEKPAVVGLTAYKHTLPASLYALKLTKKKFPHIKTLMGGGIFVDSHPRGTPNYDVLMEYSKDFVDKFIIGQGELPFLKYLQGELPADQRVYSKADIDGRILQFSEVDLPDYSDFDLSQYPYLVATGSSSCPNNCSFCCAQNFYGPYRKKDAELLASQMIHLHQKYSHQLFFMSDSLLNPVATDLAKELIKSELSVYYDSYFRVDHAAADIENTLLWRRSGLYRIRTGAESGSQKILDFMGKGITPDMTRAAISSFAHAGIKTTTYWVIGHPGETEEDFQATLDLISELKDDIYQAEANPFHYHSTSQLSGDQWDSNKMDLFSETAQKMIVFKAWTLNLPPLREEAYNRLYRFEEHNKSIGIPNPYSLNEYMKAEVRWKNLHKNAVPSVLDFISKEKYVNENKNIKTLTHAKNTRQTVEEFAL